MAINVNEVYKTVLLILNKEQRGYLTPDEFNKIAAQCQLEIFESYFEELNQQYRLPDNNSEYSDRLKNLREKISIFQEEGQCSYVGPYFSLPTNSTTAQAQSITTQFNSAQYTINQINAATLESGQVTVTLEDANGALQPLTEGTEWTLSNSILSLNPVPPNGRLLVVTVTDFLIYKLGTVIYDDEKEVQYVQPNELLELNLSPLTKPSNYFPVYKYSDFQITVFPRSITSNISCTFLRKPLNPIWNFVGATSGDNFQYSYDSTTSIGFELHATEQTDLILKILLYAGVVIRDPQIIQVAASQIQADNQNEKS